MAGIDLIDVYKSYRLGESVVDVLLGIDLNIPEGRITVILGKSGCGKTTLLRLIGGLENFDRGKISNPNSKKSAFVFQEPRLMPWLNVRRNIAFGLKDLNSKIIDELVNMVGLNGFENAYPNQLSGGMQQRASIARALAYEPSFIMMDEPFAALDYFTREQMQKELIKIQNKTNCGMLFVTHSIDEALLIAHKIIVIDNGKVSFTYNLEEDNINRNLLDANFIELKKCILQNLEG